MSLRAGFSGIFLGVLVAGLLCGGCADGGGSGGGGGGVVARADVSPESGDAPLTVVFDGSGSSGAEDLVYVWDLGDGSVSTEPLGTVTFDEPGEYVVELEVTDADGNRSQDGVLVVVAGVRDTETYEERVLYLTNLERRGAGLPPLANQGQLEAAAEDHAADMAAQDYFDHDSLDGRSFTDRLDDAGYDWNSAAENIAAGYGTPEAVVAAWMDSSGHRANILRTSVNELGVGYVQSSTASYSTYWVQDFGRRAGVYPVVIEDEAFSTDSARVSLFVYGDGWADDMMVSNDPDFTLADWEAFQEEFDWDLPAGTGLRRVYVRLRSGATVVESSDEILLR